MKNLFIYIILLLTISCDIAKEIIDSTPDAIDTWDELGDEDWGDLDLCWCDYVEYKNYGNGWEEALRYSSFLNCDETESQVGEPETKVDEDGNQYQFRIDLECESFE